MDQVVHAERDAETEPTATESRGKQLQECFDRRIVSDESELKYEANLKSVGLMQSFEKDRERLTAGLAEKGALGLPLGLVLLC